jgi:osmoprotectant transport system permease protein
VLDGLLFGAGRLLSPRRTGRRLGPVLIAVGVAVAAASLWATARDGDRIVVGSKNFTEQIILGELMAQVIERYTDLPVDRRLNLGGTFICDRAIQSGDIDLYVEYSGTALTAVFGQPVERDPANVLDRVRTLYAETGRSMLAPLGFNNTFAISPRMRPAGAPGSATSSWSVRTDLRGSHRRTACASGKRRA